MSVIDVRKLTKRFGSRIAVDAVDLSINRGEIMGFLGPNGSGKTTTIRMVCGILTPDAGEGTVLGFDVLRQSRTIKRHVGYMTQRFTLYDDLTIEENLKFVARVHGLADPVPALEAVINQLALDDRRHQLAATLSGGLKQRLALAASLIHRPQILLLDEPTAGVDPVARRDFWDEIHRLAKTGLTVLVTTHYMDEAERCHRISFINEGRLIAIGKPADVTSEAGLITFRIEGAMGDALAADLKKVAGIERVLAFGSALHVIGTDRRVIKDAIESVRNGKSFVFAECTTSLEDVISSLMQQRR